MLNVKLVVHIVTGRLYKLGQIPYKELHSDRTTNLGTKEDVNFLLPTELEDRWSLESVGRFLKRELSCSCRDSNSGSSSAILG